MTVLSQVSKTTTVANGVTTSFPFYFKIKDSSQLRLFITDDEGNESLINNNQYVVTGIGSENGTVVYQPNGSPLASGNVVTILREVPLTQTLAVTNQSNGVSLEAIEDRFDIITFQIQQNAERINRSAALPVASNSGNNSSTGNSGGTITLPISIDDVANLQTTLTSKANISSLGELAFLDLGDGLSSNNGVLNVVDQNAALGELAALDAGNGLSISNGQLNVTGSGGNIASFLDLNEVSETITQRGGDAPTPDNTVKTHVFTVDPEKIIQFYQADTTGHAFANTFHVKREANYDNTSNISPGWVNSAGRFHTIVDANARTNEWALLGIVDNYAPSGSGSGAGAENVGVYAQGLNRSSGATWALATDCKDFSPSGTTPLLCWGAEIGLFANKQHVNNNYIGTFIVGGRADGGGDTPKFHAGLLVDSQNNENVNGHWSNGIMIGDGLMRSINHGGQTLQCDTGINIYTQGNLGIWDRGAKNIGVVLAGTYSDSALRLNSGDKISFNDSGTVTLRDASGILSAEGPIAGKSINLNETSGDIINHAAFAVNSDGRVHYKSTAVHRGTTAKEFRFDGVSYGGDFIENRVNIPGLGTVRRYAPLFRHVNDT